MKRKPTQNFVGKTNCILGYVKVEDTQKFSVVMPQTLSSHGIRWQLYLTKHGPVTQGKRFELIHLLFIKQNLFICLAPKQCRIYCKDECHTLHRVRKNSLRNTAIIFLSFGI